VKQFLARRGALVVVALGIAALAAACLPPAPPGYSAPVNDIIARQDSARRQAGLPGFLGDGGMNANAQHHAQRLASSSGGTCNVWHSGDLAAMYPGHNAGENVACIAGGCQTNGAAFVSLWLNSAGHRANIMNPVYRFIGAGAYCDGARTFAVTHFRS
jgi:uncharacterized protein YkwD